MNTCLVASHGALSQTCFAFFNTLRVERQASIEIDIWSDGYLNMGKELDSDLQHGVGLDRHYFGSTVLGCFA